ncbi:MAG: hypothetical protein Cons2KO_06910 [Congregibacter sp.]
MHRSGTSLVSQALRAAGISPGPTSGLLSAQSDNPEGFLENRELVRINDQLLAKDGGFSWFSPPSSFNFSDDRLLSDARSLLADLENSVGGQFFLKDPRLCLTWPAWASVAGNWCFVYVYRSPIAVAQSLARRNRFPLQLGLGLWEIYNRRAIASLSAENSVKVSFDRLVDGSNRLSDVVGAVTTLGFVGDADRANDVFMPSLIHHRTQDTNSDKFLLTPSQLALHDYCTSLCRGEDVAPPDLDDEELVLARTRDLASALAPLATVIESGIERDEAIALSKERTSERDTALRTLADLEKDHKSLAEAHAAEQASHKKAAQVLERLRLDHEALAGAHKAEVAERESLAVQLAELDERYRTDTTALKEKADYLFFELSNSYASLLNFEQSTLARVQRFVRRAYRLLSGQRGQNSAYEDVLARAEEHHREYELEVPELPPRKWRMALDVLSYIARNPAGSLRSFSWTRLRRAVSVFFGNSADDLQVWVNARFPDANAMPQFDPQKLDPDLDVLKLDFPEVDSPKVSIIVPVYNDYRMTINCLKSILEHTVETDYEVIIADDCSTDLTTSIQERVSGIRVSRTASNQRFLMNCKQATQQARGEFLVFLNNDTAVTAYWLRELLAVFTDPTVGVAGPKLLFADGVLQEAGGIIWKDASGWNFGRGDDRDKPAYNYLRDVDYVSGACLMIRHSLWTALAGFDERFVPAYYEDADICFAARDAGYRVLYEPRSVVYHFEGVSNGTDLNAGVKQHQVTNQQVFREKWSETLDAEHFANGESVVYARDRSAARYTVLVIDHYVPHFDKDAGGRSTFQYIQLLIELGCRVQFMGANFFPHRPYTQRLQAMGVEVLVGESIARHLDTWLAEHSPYIDEIFLHRPHVAEQFLPHLKRLKHCPPISFFGHDLHYLRMAREAAVKDDTALRKESERWRERELAVCRQVDHAYYFSQTEIDELASQVDAGKLRVVPLYAMETNAIPVYAPSEPHSILFVGGYNHPPNVDAVLWLVNDILPLIERGVGNVHLHVVGSNAPSKVTDLASAQVTVHGFLSDEALDDLYRCVGMAMVPLQYGAGVKGKVIEAVNQGVPVLTTSVGAEGIPEAGQVMWIADSAEDLAAQARLILVGSADVNERLTRAGDWIQRHFSKDTAAGVLARDRDGWTAERARR